MSFKLFEEISALIPADCGLTKIEAEGPQLVVYIKEIANFYKDPFLMNKIATIAKKKIALRCDASVLKPEKEALAKIKTLIPEEAGVTNINFDKPFNEVIIEALKPGIVIGKLGMVSKSIILETGWTPRILRAPTSPSEVIKAIRNSMLNNSEDRKKFLNHLGKKMMTAAVTKSNCEWIKITALGAFKEVGRSCLLLQTPKSNVIIDCGLNIDTSDPQRAYPLLNAMNLTFDQIDAVIITHAHLDHVGFLPYLFKYGYEGPVYCTPPTRDLMVLLQQDCLHVMNSEGKGCPFDEKDVKKELLHMVTRDYGEVTDVTPEVKFTFFNAGHVLGSTSVHLHIGDGSHNLVCSGDIKYGKTMLFDPAETRFPRVDTLLMEATYGAKEDIKPTIEEAGAKIEQIIRQTIERKGKVLIPVLAVGRAQEIMLVLEEKLKDLKIPIYIDGMSREATAIHTVYPEFLRYNVQKKILQNHSPFENDMFISMAGKNRREIIESDQPCVIIAPSGMLSGGASLEFLKLLAGDEKSSLIFVGYQAATSMGRKIQNGDKDVAVMAGTKTNVVKIKLQIHTVDGYSGHSDRLQLMAYVKNMRPRPSRIIMNHGDEAKCEELARALNKIFHIKTDAPMNLDTIRLK